MKSNRYLAVIQNGSVILPYKISRNENVDITIKIWRDMRKLYSKGLFIVILKYSCNFEFCLDIKQFISFAFNTVKHLPLTN